jgi:hypothetical protein
VEVRSLAGWPALVTHEVGGWLVRLAGGETRRANSATALDPAGSVERVRAAIEAIYAEAGLPTIFRLTPLAPDGADDDLALAGYRPEQPSLVLARPVERVRFTGKALDRNVTLGSLARGHGRRRRAEGASRTRRHRARHPATRRLRHPL